MYKNGSPEAKRADAAKQRLLSATPEELLKAAYTNKKNRPPSKQLLKRLAGTLIRYKDALSAAIKKLDELDASSGNSAKPSSLPRR